MVEGFSTVLPETGFGKMTKSALSVKMGSNLDRGKNFGCPV